MTQNIVSLNLTDDQLQAVDAALTELETRLAGLVALSVPQKRSLRKMGEKSEAFCRQAMLLLSQNPELVRSDVMVASLQVYGQLKLTGASEGLQSLRRDLGMRFARTSKPEEAKAA